MNNLQQEKKKSITQRLIETPYIIWAAGFIILPLLMVLYYGLTKKSDGSVTLENLKLIIDPVNRKILWLSIKLSLISTIACLLLAYPVALALKSLKMKSNSFVILIFMLPMWMNFLLRTIAWQNILENNGVLNQILSFLHLPTVHIINTPTAVVLGMVYDYLPFMIIPIYNVLSKIDDNVIQAARDLGANYVQTLWKVILPLSLPGVISGITMVFIPSLTTFVISDVLGGNKVILIGKVIEQQFKILNNWNAGCGMSLILMIFIFICMAIMQKYDKDEGGTNVW